MVSDTSPQRTYRYVRIALAAAPIALLISVALAVPDTGLLPTVSHYIHTPARIVFSAALIAASVCLLVLSGRGPQRVLLDVAALLAPLVAILPTPIAAGEVAGVEVSCAGSCVPDAALADVDNALVSYLVMAGLAVVVGIVLRVRSGVAGGTATTLVVAVLLLAAVALAFALARPALLAAGHVVSAVAFFVVMAAVAVAEAVRPSAQHPPSRALRGAYLGIAAVLVLDLLALGVLGLGAGLPVVFGGEVVALLLFVVFWALQTRQKWSESDPALRGPFRTS